MAPAPEQRRSLFGFFRARPSSLSGPATPRDPVSPTTFGSNLTRSTSNCTSASNSGGSEAASTDILKSSPRALFLGGSGGAGSVEGLGQALEDAVAHFDSLGLKTLEDKRSKCILLLHLGLESNSPVHLRQALEQANALVEAGNWSLHHLLRGVALFCLGDYSNAAQACQDSAGMSSKASSALPRAWLRLVQGYESLLQGASKKATDLASEGLELAEGSTGNYSWVLHRAVFPLKAALLRLRSTAHANRSRPRDATRDTEAAQAAKATVGQRQLLLGEILARFSGRKGDAVRSLKRALEEAPSDSWTRALCQLAEGLEEWERASFGAALCCSTKGLEILLGDKAGNATVATLFATGTASLDKELKELWSRADAKLNQLPPEALVTAGDDLTQRPGLSWLGHLYRGLGLLDLQRLEEAEAAVVQSLSQKHDAKRPKMLHWIVLSLLAAKGGQLDEAVDLAATGIRFYEEVEGKEIMNKDLALCHRVRGYCMLVKGNKAEALKDTGESIRLDPGNSMLGSLAEGGGVSQGELWDAIFSPQCSITMGEAADSEASELPPPSDVGPGIARAAAKRSRALQLPLDLVIEYSFQEVSQATNSFAEENKLGQGTFGAVYRGYLRGTEVAVKCMLDKDADVSGVMSELMMLSRVKHPHIVTLMGHCPDAKHPCIVYEYLGGGDLHENLERRVGARPLSCVDRLRIAKELASALVFMGQHQPPIVHRDLKPRNILLDRHGTAKIADWGLARSVAKTVCNQNLAGTHGYIAPELAAFGRELSTSSDVFAFGVILLQLFTGILKPSDLHSLSSVHGDGSLEALPPRAIVPYLDPVARPWPMPLSERVIGVALKCISTNRKARPSLSDVVLPELVAAHNEASGAGSPHAGRGQQAVGAREFGGGSPAGEELRLAKVDENECSLDDSIDERHRGGGPGHRRRSSGSLDDKQPSPTKTDSSEEDKLEKAISLLSSMNLSPEEFADAGELLLDEKRARLFLAFPDTARAAWLRKQLAKG